MKQKSTIFLFFQGKYVAHFQSDKNTNIPNTRRKSLLPNALKKPKFVKLLRLGIYCYYCLFCGLKVL